MSSIEELRKEREKKARLLEEHGMDPYASNTERTHTLQEIAASFEELANAGQAVVVDGRVMALRSHGSSAFVDINDGTETFQIFLKEDELGEGFNLFEDTVDVGDIIEVRGGLFETRTGQPSVRAESWRMLTKSLLPLPEQWYGFEDEEKRLRKRYIDILMNDDVRDMVEKKARFWQSLRSFVEEKGFIEVQTPTL